jgi:CO/xanthine dehydrogenase Mo-binding subunit
MVREFSRRAFLRGSGALIVGFSFAARALADTVNISPAGPTGIDAWITVHADNTVTVLAGKVEYGQGTTTGLRQIAAEELGVSFDQIRWVRPETGVTPNQGATVGSSSISRGGPQIRAAAAYAAQTLIGLASTQLGVPAASLSVADGVVSGGGKSVKYGDLLGGKVFNTNLPAVTLNQGVAPAKPVGSYTLVGTRVPRVDIPAKVTGTFTYMHNVRVPGMLHGRVVRPRGQAAYGTGAKPLSVDVSSVAHIPGVQIVRKGDFVGVVAPHEYDAIQAAAQLKVKWQEAPTLPGSGNIVKQMRAQDAAGTTTNGIRASAGDVGTALASAAKVVSATYSYAYQTHGPIGPNCAIADVSSSSATVLSTTQSIYDTRFTLSITLGLPESAITVQYWDGGGTFGSSGYDDVTHAAAVMSQAVGKPVRAQFMRWDEHGWDTYGPPVLADVRAGIDAKGNIVAYDSTAWGHPYVPYLAGQTTRELTGVPIPVKDLGLGSVDTGQSRYNIPNRRVTGKSLSLIDNGWLQASYLRQPLAPQNTFISEQMVDELAYAAGMDPIAFRIQNYDGTTVAGQRAIAVLQALAQVSGWQPRVAASQLAKGDVVTGRGVASNGLNAGLAEISVDRTTGKILVSHIYAVQDNGLTINPGLVENQMSGSLIMGVSRALVEEVQFSKTRVTSIDWATYPILRFKDHPKVTTVILNRPDQLASGSGEQAQAPTPAAIANAFFDATGVRIREAPMTPGRVRAVLKAAAGS